MLPSTAQTIGYCTLPKNKKGTAEYSFKYHSNQQKLQKLTYPPFPKYIYI